MTDAFFQLEAHVWEDRAAIAEQELTDLRASIRDYIAWLTEPTRGPVVFRSEVADYFTDLLAPDNEL